MDESSVKDIFEKEILVGSASIDLFGQLRPSSLLELCQGLASEHSFRLGVSREMLVEKYEAFWMLARLWFKMTRPIKAFETLTVRTWHRGAKTATIYRDFDFFIGDEQVGEAVSAWVIARWSDRQILRPSSIKEMAESLIPDRVKDIKLKRVDMPEGLERGTLREIHYSDADINGHMNNSRYLDIACDTVRYDRMKGSFLSQAQIGYLGECFPGEVLDIAQKQTGGRHFLRGSDGEGRARFEAFLEFSPAAGELEG